MLLPQATEVGNEARFDPFSSLAGIRLNFSLIQLFARQEVLKLAQLNETIFMTPTTVSKTSGNLLYKCQMCKVKCLKALEFGVIFLIMAIKCQVSLQHKNLVFLSFSSIRIQHKSERNLYLSLKLHTCFF